MLQVQRKKSYRISQNRKKMSQGSQVRGVLMHIDTPVLQQYNSIDLRSTLTSHRINHKSLSMSCHKEPQNFNCIKTKWSTLVDRYIQSKEKIQEKRGLVNSSFQFLKLDKTNRFRYLRLTRNQALPVDFSRIRNLTEDISADHQKQSRRLKTDTQPPAEMEEQLLNNSDLLQYNYGKGSKKVKERLLNYFIENYFKNKYKQSFRQKVITKSSNPLRNTYVTRCLMRNHTN